ncbi:hypothetical protein LN042_14375 [Kitasatospora sp. RB6PN24]|uniref:hypothetical protein n=1 Tax=Kitasatospora humi TaxID=2893891 RepID=UPI001E3A5E7E|nr:hypothetical protein [Kitasatospora humi]MCC9308259.1 hypothetical protein [Kitasatospora humi]
MFRVRRALSRSWDDPDDFGQPVSPGNRVIITAQRVVERAQARAWVKENIQGDFVAED